MSTLTKVLIVLLTVSTIFLCGIVVTYVANAQNFKDLYQTQLTSARTANANEQRWKTQLNEKIAEADQMKTELEGQIKSLQTQITQLKNDLQVAQRAQQEATTQQEKAISVVQSLEQTNAQQLTLLENTQAELKKTETELQTVKSNLKETNTALLEKLSIISQQDERLKELVEEKTELQNRLDQLLQNYGQRVPVKAAPSTPQVEKAKPAPSVEPIGLNGVISRVDAKNSLAQISIGSADGVKENMKFHVTRGDQFICDILILDVDTDKAVGILDRVQHQPKPGDTVSTNL